MENNILEPNNHFDFSKLCLAQPVGIQGGAYFTKFIYDNQPFYIETPKCLTKQGFIKHGKKIYTELMFDNSDSQFIQWIENLESKCHQLIYENSESWFKDKLEINDIESAFTTSLRIYKSGKYYLLRVYGKINSLTTIPNIKIYNENEVLLTIDDIKPDAHIISIIELQGIKFTNKNFQIEFEMKQTMLLTIDKLFEQCVIKKYRKPLTTDAAKNNISLLELSPGDLVLEQFPVDDSKINEDEIDLDKELNEYIPLKNINALEETELQEIDFTDSFNSLETITLKKPNEVYYKIYKEAKLKAKNSKQDALNAIIEARNIKNTYLIDSDSDSDIDSNFDLDD